MRLPLIALCLALSCPVLADTSAFPGIKKLMTEEEFSSAGLEKLSPEEREALNTWLITYTAFEAPEMRRSNKEVKQAEADHEVHANIVGEFKGWSGKTVFKLDNGQVWRQRLDGRFSYRGDDKAVIIKKNFVGYYKMTHVASGSAVGVTRLQ